MTPSRTLKICWITHYWGAKQIATTTCLNIFYPTQNCTPHLLISVQIFGCAPVIFVITIAPHPFAWFGGCCTSINGVTRPTEWLIGSCNHMMHWRATSFGAFPLDLALTYSHTMYECKVLRTNTSAKRESGPIARQIVDIHVHYMRERVPDTILASASDIWT